MHAPAHFSLSPASALAPGAGPRVVAAASHRPWPASTGQRVLVLGANGAAGRAIAQALALQGMQVTAAGRAAQPEWPAPAKAGGLSWRQVDVFNPATLRAAAQDCDVIVHAVNPPSYTRWSTQLLPMLDAVLAAVAHPEVTVVVPGNVYGLQPGAQAQDEATPQVASHTHKGRLRQAMEARLQAAAQAGQCRSLLVRAGDFFGPHAPNGWLAQAMLGAGWPVRRIWQPGVVGVGHQWAYLPDFAHTVALLLQRRTELPRHAVFHTGGHWDADGQTLVRTLAALVREEQAEAGQRDASGPPVRAFPWWALRLAAPVHAMSREVLDMRWLWQQPIRLDNGKLRALLGQEPHTPWRDALRTTLAAVQAARQPHRPG